MQRPLSTKILLWLGSNVGHAHTARTHTCKLLWFLERILHTVWLCAVCTQRLSESGTVLTVQSTKEVSIRTMIYFHKGSSIKVALATQQQISHFHIMDTIQSTKYLKIVKT